MVEGEELGGSVKDDFMNMYGGRVDRGVYTQVEMCAQCEVVCVCVCVCVCVYRYT